MPDTQHPRWHDRDLPFLLELVRLTDEDPLTPPTTHDVAAALAWDTETALLSRNDLARDGLVRVIESTSDRPALGTASRRLDVTGDALRLANVWPTAETAHAQMVTALQQIAKSTTEDEDTRSRARKALDALTGGGKHIGLAVATAWVTGRLPK